MSDYMKNDRDNDMVTYELRGHGTYRAKSWVVDRVMAERLPASPAQLRAYCTEYSGTEIDYSDVHSVMAFIMILADGRQGSVDNAAEWTGLSFTASYYPREDGGTDIRNDANGDLMGWTTPGEKHGPSPWYGFTPTSFDARQVVSFGSTEMDAENRLLDYLETHVQ